LKTIGEAILSLAFFAGVGALLYWLFPFPSLPERIPYQSVELQRDVHYVTSRAWPKRTWFNIEPPSVTLRRPVELKWLAGTSTGVGFANGTPVGELPAGPVIVLVHGYSAPEHKVASYFAPFIDGLRGASPATFIVYDWPSTAQRFEDLTIEQRRDWISPPVGKPGQGANWFGGVSWEANAYNADRDAAQTAGAAGLVALLQALRARIDPARIMLIAHSMGSFVVMEAIARDPDSFTRLPRLVLLAPDVPRDALAAAKIQNALVSIGQVHIFFSRNDDILRLSQLKNNTARLGRDGPGDAAALPRNVQLHDMSGTLGTGDGVHGRYLEPEGVLAVAQVLK
jgi:pimeloyl-ACP methyl ester carboxylesterase